MTPNNYWAVQIPSEKGTAAAYIRSPSSALASGQWWEDLNGAYSAVAPLTCLCPAGKTPRAALEHTMAAYFEAFEPS